MTQLQQIENEFSKISTGSLVVQFWKKAILKGDVVKTIQELKTEVKENREWLTANIGEPLTQMIEQFNPLNAAYLKLADLNELWIQPKDSKNFQLIRKTIAEIETLFKIAELK